MEPLLNQKLFKQYQESFELIKKQSLIAQKQFNEQFINPLKGFSLFSQNQISAIEHLNDSFSQQLKSTFQPFFELIQSPEFYQNLQKMAEGFKALEHFNQTMENSAPLLKNYHWLIPNSMDFPYVRKDIYAVLAAGEAEQSKIDELFVRYYSHNNFEKLDQIIENCVENDLDSDRLQIIQDCVLLLRNSDSTEDLNVHNLIIPTLMIHIDRLHEDIRAIFIQRYNLTSKKAMAKALEFHRSDLENELAILNISIDLVTGYIFRDSRQIDRDDDPQKHTHLYRNKIIHGESLAYGNLTNTIRTFLIFEVLCGFYAELNEKFDQESREEPPDSTYTELIKTFEQITRSDCETQCRILASTKNEINRLYKIQPSQATYSAKTLFIIEKIIKHLEANILNADIHDLVIEILKDLNSNQIDVSKFRAYLESLFELGILFPNHIEDQSASNPE